MKPHPHENAAEQIGCIEAFFPQTLRVLAASVPNRAVDKENDNQRKTNEEMYQKLYSRTAPRPN